eukprot:TRINITY_DN17009_c0_g1_i1.p1 TRINITY_DN17009_c0_g1~~TRINITY_DN17009_c0_g1_i1.p1  ORF type:complete len:307 (+),score=45.63 TRINITY_DN17009_c0_g1_i1:67-987(+)
MAAFFGSQQNRSVWEGVGIMPASTCWTTTTVQEPSLLPMYVVSQIPMPPDASPTTGPLPARVPFPAFVTVPDAHGPQENTSDYYSDTSSTTCPEEELAAKNASQVNLANMPTFRSPPGLVDFAITPSAKVSRSQVAATSKPGSSKKTSWKLVWCCERCNKATNSETKNVFQTMAKMLGGTLHCLKKADKIKAHPAKGHFIMVADWREAKPIVDIFAQDTSMIRPSLMLIICSTGRSYENAVQWVAKEAVLKAPGTNFEVFHGQNDAPDNIDGFFASMQRAAQMFASKPEPKAPTMKVLPCPTPAMD